ncbi:hypothetical protein [Streptomyces chilikensis]|uniref:Uncharacterized protein n=1 Tax=Streptomyces chilikensis TaxID=1194079 RepID=A0ABV3EZB7_9ACTN
MTNPPTAPRLGTNESRFAIPARVLSSQDSDTLRTDPAEHERDATIRGLRQIMADLLLTGEPYEVFHEYDRLRLVRRLTGGLSPYRELLLAHIPPLREPVLRREYGLCLRQADTHRPQITRPATGTPGVRRVPAPRYAPSTAARAEARRNGLL